MKKIIYFLLLLINCFVFGQQYPTIHPLQGGFTFTGEKLDSNPQVFGVSTPIGAGCSVNFSNNYKFYSFKASFDMVFAFDLIATKPDFRFVVWKLTKDKLPTAIFESGGTITAHRSVQGTSNIKGLREGLSNICESNFNAGAIGYAKAFEGDEILKKDETIVIVIYGTSDTDLFDIKVNVAEEREINTFNNLCAGESYTHSQLEDAVKTNSGLTNIKFYTDTTFNSEISTSTIFNSATTVYAQVRDAAGNLKYIYKIPLQFVPEHQFNYKTSVQAESSCTTNYIIPEVNILLSKVLNNVIPEYSISSLTIKGITYNIGDSVPLITGEETSIKIKVNYNGSCPIESNEISIPLKQGSPVLSSNISSVTCDNQHQLLYSEVYSKLGIDQNQYDLEVRLNGNLVSNETLTPITSSLTYKIKVKSKSSNCESNEVDFIVTKTSQASIVNATISGICLVDFSQTDIDYAVSTIQNGNNYQLKYFQENGTELAFSSLFEFVKNNKTGKIIVKALASDNIGICDTTTELAFNLDQSSFTKVENIETLKSSCSEIGLGYTFTKSEIENYLKVKLNRADIIFDGIVDVSLTDNQSSSLTFKIQVNGEACWSEEMQISLQVITKPNLPEASKELQADCANLISINENVLKEFFGTNSTIDFKYEIQHQNSTPLTFDANGKASIKILFKNKLDESCLTEKTIIVNKTQDLVVDVASLENYTKENEVIYCEDDSQGAENQIQGILDYIKSQYPTLVVQSSVDQIFTQFNSNKGVVEVIFNDPSFCGSVTIKLFYQKNLLPTIIIPENATVCSGELFVLDFTAQTNYSNYNYLVEKQDGSRVFGIDKFELNIGSYKITIEDKLTNCSIVKTLVVENSELPTIEKITINQGNIIVVAKGNGSLEYALFDDKENLVVNWQSSNTLNVPAGNINNNFTVKVRLNNCGTVEVSDIVYLDLPNFVSPNGDGKNDVWQPMVKNGQATDTKNSYKLIIFDRFGKQILIQEGINIIKWDGTHIGKPVADGTYWYLLEFSKESSLLNVQYSGSILVKRKIN